MEARGSITSFESAKILVREDGSMTGTIGGGCVEAESVECDNGLICGGQLDVFVEPILPVPDAFIFGAGHISKSLSKVATLAGFNAS